MRHILQIIGAFCVACVPAKELANCVFGEDDEIGSLNPARYNSGPHLVVAIPDGHSTISCVLSNGRKVTFAFGPHEANGIPKCVDIIDHSTHYFAERDGGGLPIQEVTLRSAVTGHVVHHAKPDLCQDEPVTCTILSLTS